MAKCEVNAINDVREDSKNWILYVCFGGYVQSGIIGF